MLSVMQTGVGKWTIGNSLTPIEGPRALVVPLDFSLDTDFSLDSLNVIQGQQEKFSMVQTVYVDLSRTDASLIITVGKSGQQIIAKGRTQGYYPIVAPNQWLLGFSCADALAKVLILVCNYAVAPGIWSATQ
jgi:hypothetical protein